MVTPDLSQVGLSACRASEQDGTSLKTDTFTSRKERGAPKPTPPPEVVLIGVHLRKIDPSNRKALTDRCVDILPVSGVETRFVLKRQRLQLTGSEAGWLVRDEAVKETVWSVFGLIRDPASGSDDNSLVTESSESTEWCGWSEFRNGGNGDFECIPMVL
jgi:hypothetical protein